MRFRRKLSPQANVNLVPMIDVIFQLVAFFMVATTAKLGPNIPIIFPGSTTSEPAAYDKLVITVISRDEVYINRDRYSIEELEVGLAAIGDEEREQIKSVILEGDSNVSYDLIVKVLDALRYTGFRGVNLRTRQIE